MELRHLRYFVAVAEELHFRRAAERLHVAQPAVSEQIRKLEAELGVLLLNRTQRAVSLTPAGSVLLEEARRVLRQADLARDAVRNARSHQLGRLRIGYVPDAVPGYFPTTLARFAAAAPGMELVLETGSPRALAADVRSGRVDIALVSLPVPAAGLRVTVLAEEGAVCAVPSGHSLARADSIAPAQMSQSELVLVPRASNPAFYDGVLAAWHEAGLSAQPREVEPHVEHALLAVAAGNGVAVLPASAAERYHVAGVSFVPLDASVVCRLAVLSRPEDSTTITGFVRLARSMASTPRRRELQLAA